MCCGPEEELHAVLEEERDAERADQRRDARRGAQRPVGEPLDRDPDDGTADHRREHHQEDHEPDRDCRVSGAAEEMQHAEADVGADHEDVAVGEVEELEDPVHHRVPEGDQGIDAAERGRVDERLEEPIEIDRCDRQDFEEGTEADHAVILSLNRLKGLEAPALAPGLEVLQTC